MKFFIIIKEHSQRLPNKNFLKLGDKPLYKHLLDELDGEKKKEFFDYVDKNWKADNETD